MISQIILGSFLVVLSVVIQVTLFEIAGKVLQRQIDATRTLPLKFSTFVVTASAFTTWLLLGLLVIVCLWTILFLGLDVFSTVEEGFYFSLVAFTTLGFGDVILPEQWRVLSGFVAVDGFLLFGLNTAVMIEVMMRLRGRTD